MTDRRTTSAHWRNSDDDETTVVEIDVDEMTEAYGTTRKRLEQLSNEQLVVLNELHERREWLADRGWTDAEELTTDCIKEIIHPNFESDRVTERIESLRDRIETKDRYNRPTERTQERLQRYRMGRRDEEVV